MKCPFCNNLDTAVKDSRTTEDQAAIRRRRYCMECGSRFTTFERPHLRDLIVVKKDGRHVPFDRDKLSNAVSSAMHKHSLDPQKIETVVSGVVRKLEFSNENIISSSKIGEMLMQSLYNVDPVAYIRFASIYQDFGSTQDFMDCISVMHAKTSELSETPLFEDPFLKSSDQGLLKKQETNNGSLDHVALLPSSKGSPSSSKKKNSSGTPLSTSSSPKV